MFFKCLGKGKGVLCRGFGWVCLVFSVGLGWIFGVFLDGEFFRVFGSFYLGWDILEELGEVGIVENVWRSVVFIVGGE